MLFSPGSWTANLSKLVVIGLLSIGLISQSLAEVRSSRADYSKIRAPVRTAQQIVRFHGRTRGILLDSSATFVLERGLRQIAVAPAAVAIEMDAAQRVFLVYAGRRFEMEVHRGISCPLGRFVLRNGNIAYTVSAPPRYQAQLRTDNMVEGVERWQEDGTPLGREWLPREFAGTPFNDLLFAADLTEEVTQLPGDVSLQLLAHLNLATRRLPRSLRGFTPIDGSYINTDSLIPYRVFLVERANRVDISGVPLRYTWIADSGGSLLIRGVYPFSDEFTRRGITNFTGGRRGEPTHYDVIVLYQTAAVFRQLNRAQPARFRQFVTRACAA